MKNILSIILICFAFTSKAQINDTKILDLIESQHYSELASYIESYYPNGIDDHKMLGRLAYAYYMSGNVVKAENNYLKLLAKDSTSFPTLNSLANIANKRGNYPQMINYYQKILEIDSSNFYIIKQTVFAYQQMSNYDLEFRYLQKASKINPQDADVAYDYSKMLLNKKRLKQADSIINLAFIADSTNMLLLRGLMTINYTAEDYLKAVNRGETLLKLGDTSNETKSKLAQSYYYTRQYQKCIDLMKEIILSDAANETTFYFTSLSYRNLKNLNKSNEYLEIAIEAGISNNIGIYYQELAKNNEDAKQFITSITNYKKALAYNPKINIIHYSIARIYDAELKKPKTALVYYKKYLKGADTKRKYEQPYIDYSAARVKEINLMK